VPQGTSSWVARIEKARQMSGFFCSLEWRYAFRTFDWASEYPDPEYHLKAINGLLALAK
jgi:hypothetical protein